MTPCGAGLRSLHGPQGGSLLPLPASGGSRRPGPVAASLPSLPPAPRGNPSMSVSVLSLMRTPVTGCRATLVQGDLTPDPVLNPIGRDPVSKLGSIPEFKGLKFQHMGFGDRIQPTGCVWHGQNSCDPVSSPKPLGAIRLQVTAALVCDERSKSCRLGVGAPHWGSDSGWKFWSLGVSRRLWKPGAGRLGWERGFLSWAVAKLLTLELSSTVPCGGWRPMQLGTVASGFLPLSVPPGAPGVRLTQEASSGSTDFPKHAHTPPSWGCPVTPAAERQFAACVPGSKCQPEPGMTAVLVMSCVQGDTQPPLEPSLRPHPGGLPAGGHLPHPRGASFRAPGWSSAPLSFWRLQNRL